MNYLPFPIHYTDGTLAKLPIVQLTSDIVGVPNTEYHATDDYTLTLPDPTNIPVGSTIELLQIIGHGTVVNGNKTYTLGYGPSDGKKLAKATFEVVEIQGYNSWLLTSSAGGMKLQLNVAAATSQAQRTITDETVMGVDQLYVYMDGVDPIEVYISCTPLVVNARVTLTKTGTAECKVIPINNNTFRTVGGNTSDGYYLVDGTYNQSGSITIVMFGTEPSGAYLWIPECGTGDWKRIEDDKLVLPSYYN